MNIINLITSYNRECHVNIQNASGMWLQLNKSEDL